MKNRARGPGFRRQLNRQLRSARAERVVDDDVAVSVLAPLVEPVVPAVEPVEPAAAPGDVPAPEVPVVVSVLVPAPVVEPVPAAPAPVVEPVVPAAPVPAPLTWPAGLLGSVLVPGVPAIGLRSVPEPLGPDELPPWFEPADVPVSEEPAVEPDVWA
jgi:hypothetical protein